MNNVASRFVKAKKGIHPFVNWENIIHLFYQNDSGRMGLQENAGVLQGLHGWFENHIPGIWFRR